VFANVQTPDALRGSLISSEPHPGPIFVLEGDTRDEAQHCLNGAFGADSIVIAGGIEPRAQRR
jgi:hypothetical protein